MGSSVQDEYDEAEESIKQHERSRSSRVPDLIRSGMNESDAESGLLGKKKEVAEKSACDWGSVELFFRLSSPGCPASSRRSP